MNVSREHENNISREQYLYRIISAEIERCEFLVQQVLTFHELKTEKIIVEKNSIQNRMKILLSQMFKTWKESKDVELKQKYKKKIQKEKTVEERKKEEEEEKKRDALKAFKSWWVGWNFN